MAYDIYLGERISQILKSRNILFTEKKMMGALIFMVNEKMCIGIHINKKYGDSLIMAKIGAKAYEVEIKKEVCLPMDFSGRPSLNFIYITPDGFDMDNDLEYWVDKALDFNLNDK